MCGGTLTSSNMGSQISFLGVSLTLVQLRNPTKNLSSISHLIIKTISL